MTAAAEEAMTVELVAENAPAKVEMAVVGVAAKAAAERRTVAEGAEVSAMSHAGARLVAAVAVAEWGTTG